MIIISNPNIICTDQYWNTLWEYCKKNGGCIPFEKCPLSPLMIAKLQKNYQANSNKILRTTKKNGNKSSN